MAAAGAAVLVLTSTVSPVSVGFARPVLAEVTLLDDDTALMLGATGVPIPTPTYISDLNDLFVHCDPPACITQGLATPEAWYPLTGVNSLYENTSATQGATILDNAITQQLADGYQHVTVFGYSQGAQVESLAMDNIVNGSAGTPPSPDQLSFVLIGDPDNPNGGILERFDLPADSNPSIPSLGITLDGATPVTEYPTDIYTMEYDFVGDVPRYPLDFLSDLNSLIGGIIEHLSYPSLTAEQVANAVEVPTSAGYDGSTDYYMIPAEHLPLLDPLRLTPAGALVADLIGPDMRVLVNLGYGDPDYGWVNNDANVPTTIGLLPSLADFEKVPGLLVQGAEEGIQRVISDLQNPSQLSSPAEDPLLALLQNPVDQALEPLLLPATTSSDSSDILLSLANALGGAFSAGSEAPLPLVDAVDALTTTLPAYDANIFSAELADGNLLGAIGVPIGADFELVPFAVGLGAAGFLVQAGIAIGDLVAGIAQ